MRPKPKFDRFVIKAIYEKTNVIRIKSRKLLANFKNSKTSEI